MEAAEAVRRARVPIELLASRRYDPQVRELVELNERHRFFGVYILGRTAPLHAGPRTAAALATMFPFGLVSRFFEKVAAVQPIEEVRGLYLAACEAIGKREFTDLPDAGELADLLDTVVAHADVAGCPLAAAWAELPAPRNVGARIERASTVLREHRGAGHLAVLKTHGLQAPDALIVASLWSGDGDPEGGTRWNGWRDDDLAAAWVRLDAAGRTAERQLTAVGRDERDAIEDLTHALASQPWARLDEGDRVRTVELLEAAVALVSK